MTDGILLIDKPSDFTSFDVIAKLRGMTKIKKIGHAGTLDPLATGVLVVLVGTATKLCDTMPATDKEYEADILFGFKTDTQDISGKVIDKSDIKIERKDLEKVISEFIGNIKQVPPMYSAVQVKGKHLYDYAREGREIERQEREITIYSLEVLDFDFEKQSAKCKVKCSSGTYVRTLFDDIGQKLKCFATLKDLRRTSACGFDIKDCITLEKAQELTDEGTILDRVIKTETAFLSYPILKTGEWQKKMLLNGINLSLPKLNFPEPGYYRVYVEDEFIGVGFVDSEKTGMRLKRF